MASYTKMTVGKENRTELHEKLALTGAEISLFMNAQTLFSIEKTIILLCRCY